MNQLRSTLLSSKPVRRLREGPQRPARETEANPAATPEIPSAVRPQPLRRWSVAELIARAAVAPPGEGVTRG